MSDNLLEAQATLRMARPAPEVFEAILDPTEMSHYFISSGSARLATGRTIRWEFADAGASFDIEVDQIEPDRLIAFRWPATGPGTRVRLTLRPDGEDACIVEVRETGWPADPAGIQRCIGNSKGWVHFLCCLKAYVDFGIDLRAGGVVAGHL
ncbi:MAG TPA: SRPBCC domain-containing protein [Gemmatimonadales bacterium]|nr:SRPBCC domain-containing protein [Gemmatimonadales bacterium]